MCRIVGTRHGVCLVSVVLFGIALLQYGTEVDILEFWRRSINHVWTIQDKTTTVKTVSITTSQGDSNNNQTDQFVPFSNQTNSHGSISSSSSNNNNNNMQWKNSTTVPDSKNESWMNASALKKETADVVSQSPSLEPGTAHAMESSSPSSPVTAQSTQEPTIMKRGSVEIPKESVITQYDDVEEGEASNDNNNNATELSAAASPPTPVSMMYIPDPMALDRFIRRPLMTNGSIHTNQTPAIAIVIQLSGEMGNQLCHLAHGYGLSLWLEREFNTSSYLVLRHQDHNKWLTARAATQDLFPFTRTLNFEEANTDEFNQKLKIQQDWLGSTDSVVLDGINYDNVTDPNTQPMQAALQLVVDRAIMPPSHSAGGDDGVISLPFLYSTAFVTTNVFVDRYYQEYRDLFQLDTSKCHLRPDPDETVFHFRNFLHEMPRRGKPLGYAEMGPNQTARALFGHLEPGDKVAIITRFDEEYAQPYVDALQQHGLQVRVIQGQTGSQDFCFLMSAQKGMVGIVLSTYFGWAALLSNATRIMAYSIDSDERRNLTDMTGPVYRYYNWTNPALQNRFLFSLHRPDPSLDPDFWRRRRPV